MAKLVFNAGVFKDSPLFAADTATEITVLDRSDDTLAQLWSDRAGAQSLGNPFFIASPGIIQFYADAGRFRVTASNGGFTQTWDDIILIDPDAVGGTTLLSLTDTMGSYTANQPIRANSAGNAIEHGVGALTTEELTANKTLAAADLGKSFYVLAATSADITLTIPAGLGNGFHCSFVHEGSGVFTVAGSGVTPIPPADGALTLPTGGYGSLMVFGSDDLIKLAGLVDPSST